MKKTLLALTVIAAIFSTSAMAKNDIDHEKRQPSNPIEKVDSDIDHEKRKPSNPIEKVDNDIDHEKRKPSNPIEKVDNDIDHEKRKPSNPIEKPSDGNDGDQDADIENPIRDAGNIDEAKARIDNAKNTANTRINEAEVRADALDNRVENLEAGFQQMANDMLGLEERMDGVVASSHAIVNARPMVSSAGEFAMGVGMGYAGSKEAIAIGGAYAFNENWSASATFNYETSGSYSSSQVSGGAGVQYKF